MQVLCECGCGNIYPDYQMVIFRSSREALYIPHAIDAYGLFKPAREIRAKLFRSEITSHHYVFEHEKMFKEIVQDLRWDIHSGPNGVWAVCETPDDLYTGAIPHLGNEVNTKAKAFSLRGVEVRVDPTLRENEFRLIEDSKDWVNVTYRESRKGAVPSMGFFIDPLDDYDPEVLAYANEVLSD